MNSSTRLFLIRHGKTDYIGRALAGRLPDIHLNHEGTKQAKRIAERLQNDRIQRIICSPLERARETAGPAAEALKLEIELAPELNELEFGSWTSQSFEALSSSPDWERFNRIRSLAEVPSGEFILEAQLRITRYLLNLRREMPGKSIALFSHADLIKSAMLYFLGIPLDFFHRLEISPGSISLVELSDWGPRVLLVNG
jgi:broad specificity phosphatase PhoE